jgi:D-aminoacyl-tRNA deacylase
MRAVIQRVAQARVRVDGQVVGEIGQGILLFLGVGKGETRRQADALLEKAIHLRIFEDPEGKMNLSLRDIQGMLLVVSQFTLYADCRKGRRPSFTDAGPPEEAKALYEYFLQKAEEQGVRVASGLFQAHMEVELVNSGPVTIVLDSSRDF